MRLCDMPIVPDNISVNTEHGRGGREGKAGNLEDASPVDSRREHFCHMGARSARERQRSCRGYNIIQHAFDEPFIEFGEDAMLRAGADPKE